MSKHHFGFRTFSHSTLNQLLLLHQQWMESLNLKQEVRTVSGLSGIWHRMAISSTCQAFCPFDLLSWLANFFHSHNQHLTLNGIVSPLPVEARILQMRFSAKPVTHVHKIPYALDNYLYLIADNSTLCTSLRANSSYFPLCWWRKDQILVLQMSFNRGKAAILSLSVWKQHLWEPTYFYTIHHCMRFSVSNSWTSVWATSPEQTTH